jgi:hypothetical protein
MRESIGGRCGAGARAGVLSVGRTESCQRARSGRSGTRGVAGPSTASG